jgi:hypothetical protein
MSYIELAKKMTYNKDTGKVYWKEGLGHRYSGKEAGCIYDEDRQRFKIKYNNKRYFRARLAWVIHYGEEPKGLIDHINGEQWDDRLVNLRDVTSTENSLNCRKSRRNKTGITGVFQDKYGSYKVTYRKTYLGTYKSLEDAREAREAAEKGCPYITNRHGK